MSLKLFAFIWVIWVVAIFLGSTFEYRDTVAEAGIEYSTGTAIFTQGDATVTGVLTVWVVGMEGGIIKYDADDIWCKIIDVVNPLEITLAFDYPGAGGGAAAYSMATSKAWMGEAETTTLDFLMNWKNAIYTADAFGVIPIPFPNKEYFTTWFHVVTLQFDFLQGTGYKMFYWIVLAPIAIMGVLAMILLFVGLIRGNISWG